MGIVEKIKFIDLFAGIGGFHLALESLGLECVFASEWDKYAQSTYTANFGMTPVGDIRAVEAASMPSFDWLCAGFPCQPFSIAGVSKKNSLGHKHGFEDEKQGNLFFEILRIASFHHPKVMLLENVKNLKSHDKGNTWHVIESELKALGYQVFSKILDGKYFVPQHRERIFIVCFDTKTYPKIDFRFSNYPKHRNYELKEIIEPRVEDKYTLTTHLWNYLFQRKIEQSEKGNGFGYGLFNPNIDEYTRTISARYYKDGSEVLIEQVNQNPRRLTPRESARLQGYPESFKIPVSDTQAYRQFGNSVVVPLVQAVAAQILETIQNYEAGKSRLKYLEQSSLWEVAV